MHHALEIDEILETVLLFTSPSTDASMARVCKSFSGFALNALWYHIDHLDCLNGIIEIHDAYEDKQLERGHWEYRIKSRAMAPAFWERINFYISRVRSLDLTDYTCRSILRNLRDASDSPVVFDRTRQITIIGSAHNGMSADVAELHPQIKDLTLECFWPNPIITSRAPHLTRLCVVIPTKRLLDDRWAYIIKNLPLLEVYEGGIPGPGTWLALSQLQSLKTLVVLRANLSQQLWWVDSQFNDTVRCSSLQSFTVDSVRLPPVTRLIQRALIGTQARIIRLTHVRIATEHPESVIEEFVGTLEPYLPSLEQLVLSIKSPRSIWLSPMSPSLLSDLGLCTLRRCTNMTQLTVKTTSYIPMTDKAFTAIISNMPRLQELVFNTTRIFCQDADRLSLHVLSFLLSHCPLLHTIGLGVGSSGLPTKLEHLPSSFKVSSLRIYLVDEIVDVERTVEFLKALFPCISVPAMCQFYRPLFMCCESVSKSYRAHEAIFRCRRQIKYLVMGLKRDSLSVS